MSPVTALRVNHPDTGEVVGEVPISGRLPVALVAGIAPFTHPLTQGAHTRAPAVAAGAPIVVKPSERTPLAAVRLFQLLSEAGLPVDATRVVCGDPAEIVDVFLAHPDWRLAVELREIDDRGKV